MTTMKGTRLRVGSRTVRLGLLANLAAIKDVTAAGAIAVVAFEATGDAAGLAKLFGWDGIAPVFRLSESMRAAFAAAGVDPVTLRWLTRESGDRRVLLLTREGSQLLNLDEHGDWWIEPGQLDQEEGNGT